MDGLHKQFHKQVAQQKSASILEHIPEQLGTSAQSGEGERYVPVQPEAGEKSYGKLNEKRSDMGRHRYKAQIEVSARNGIFEYQRIYSPSKQQVQTAANHIAERFERNDTPERLDIEEIDRFSYRLCQTHASKFCRIQRVFHRCKDKR